MRLFVFAILMTASSAFANPELELPLHQLGTGSVLRVEQDIIVGANVKEVVLKASDESLLRCKFTMKETSAVVRSIPKGMEYSIQRVNLNYVNGQEMQRFALTSKHVIAFDCYIHGSYNGVSELSHGSFNDRFTEQLIILAPTPQVIVEPNL